MKSAFAIITSLCFVITLGCSGESKKDSEKQNVSAPSGSSEYLLDKEPEKFTQIIECRKASKDNDDVVVIGKIGGSADPWIEGMAAFTIVDLSLKSCSDIPGDNCPQPWDYCCESTLPESTALVQVVDKSGKTVTSDAKELLGVKELSTVIAKGKAKRDDKGNLTIMASSIFVKQK